VILVRFVVLLGCQKAATQPTLLSNVVGQPADTLALWYYWRWQIECFFKLLKTQGLHLEDWQQESGLAIACSSPAKSAFSSGNLGNKTRLKPNNLNTSSSDSVDDK
jgi:hypothetical protein